MILPGSKATLADLASLKAEGWDLDLRAHLRRGGLVLGLCGGYQMLGQRVSDPKGIEGPPGTAEGLALLDVETQLTPKKALVETSGTEIASAAPVEGYEMHIGETLGSGLAKPFLALNGRTDGAVSADGRVFGCYLHGLFASDRFRAAFLGRIKARGESGLAYEQEVEATLDHLADHLEAHLDLPAILEAARRRTLHATPRS